MNVIAVNMHLLQYVFEHTTSIHNCNHITEILSMALFLKQTVFIDYRCNRNCNGFLCKPLLYNLL